MAWARVSSDLQLSDLSPPPRKSLQDKPLPTPTGRARLSIAVERAKHTVEKDVFHKIPPWLQLSGWRATVTGGAGLATVVLILNISLLAWSYTRPADPVTGMRVLSQEECSASQNGFTLSHLGINILSTLLLGTSNAAMQCLSAPTRQAVDRAHAQGKWLDVGISSLRNWYTMDTWRKCCWLFLALSSLPLHLLYNSAIFSTTSGNEYFAIAVTEGFLTNQEFVLATDYGYNFQPPTRDLVSTLQTNASTGKLTRLENRDCIQTYNSFLTSQYSNVILVSSLTNNTNSVLEVFLYTPTPLRGEQDAAIIEPSWICGDEYEGCDPNSKLNDTAAWTLLGTQIGKIPVQYCLAQPITKNCSLQLIPSVMIVVIICNALKVACLILATRVRGYDPLITLGDAIDSFLSEPDPYSRDMGPISARDLRAAEQRVEYDRICQRIRPEPLAFVEPDTSNEDGSRNQLPLQSKAWKVRRLPWTAGAGRLRWGLTYAFIAAFWLIGWAIFGYTGSAQLLTPDVLAQQWSTGLGNVSPAFLLEITSSISLFGNIFLANIPQLFLSATYICYNGVFTCIFLSREFTQYAVKRNGLRVTFPSGRYQRSTYWLSLPYKFSVPLLVLAFLLHWLVSQTIFLAEVTVVDPYGNVDANYSVNCLGYSTLALLIALLLGGLIIFTPLAIRWIHYSSRAPLVESCSLAISAACHPPTYRQDERLQLLKFGVPTGSVDDHACPCLTSDQVGDLVEGEYYSPQPRGVGNATFHHLATIRRYLQIPVFVLELSQFIRLVLMLAIVGSTFSEINDNVASFLYLDGLNQYYALSEAAIGLSILNILYSIARMISDAVRWRKQWVLRILSWQAVPEILFLAFWTTIFVALCQVDSYRYTIDELLRDLNPDNIIPLDPLQSTVAITFFIFFLHLGSTGTELWLWWRLQSRWHVTLRDWYNKSWREDHRRTRTPSISA